MVTKELNFNGTQYTLGADAENVDYGNRNVKQVLDELIEGGGNGAVKMTNYNLLSKLDAVGTPSSYADNTYIVGYNKRFESRSLLTSVKINMASPAVGDAVRFYLADVDQRDWLIPRLTFEARVTSVETNNGRNVAVIDLEELGIIANENDLLFMQVLKSGNTFGWLASAAISGVACYYTTDIVSGVSTSQSAVADIEISAKSIDTIFALDVDLKDARDGIAANTEAIAASRFIKDKTTGISYRLVVDNGVLGIEAVNATRLLVLGHSFCTVEQAEFWVCNDHRGFAATVPGNDYVSRLAEIISATTVKKLNVSAWENNSVDYDFSNWKIDGSEISDDYDVVLLFTGENFQAPQNMTQTEQDEFIQAAYEEAIDYIKGQAPSAELYVANIMHASPASKAARAKGVEFINLLPVQLLGLKHNLQGSYYIGNNNTYYVEWYVSAYASHPSDIDMWNLAKAIATGMGFDVKTERAHNITVNSTAGGTLTLASEKWVENGVVSVKCEADDGYTISALSVVGSNGTTVEATQRTNEYGTFYTFIMPARDVTITPTWAANT